MSEVGGERMKSIVPVPYVLDPDSIIIPHFSEYAADYYEKMLEKFGDDVAEVIARGYTDEGYMNDFLLGKQIVIGVNISRLRKMNLLDDNESIVSLMKAASKSGLGKALVEAGEDLAKNLFYLSAEVSDEDPNHVDIFMRRIKDKE